MYISKDIVALCERKDISQLSDFSFIFLISCCKLSHRTIIEDIVNNFICTGRLVNGVNPEGSTIEDSEHSSGNKESSKFCLLTTNTRKL
ncbi:hypothetical protein RN001_002705 [Aquatica leii]|uniref:Uncharacterized protein n=1 Tax=Aquatica leii TaxID=1421715 RepID=A0AAN7PH90_9COLE|nr:hypothetical protein RN001_002705 [Aquatica leii]